MYSSAETYARSARAVGVTLPALPVVVLTMP